MLLLSPPGLRCASSRLLLLRLRIVWLAVGFKLQATSLTDVLLETCSLQLVTVILAF
jgi:hypothetical protein